MRNRHSHPNAVRWCVQVAIAASVVAASVVLVTGRHESARALPAPQVLGEAPIVRPEAATLMQTVTAERPPGQIAVAISGIDPNGRLGVTVTDTRAEDPGWSVTMTVTDATGRSQEWTTGSVDPTPAFADGAGHSYAQQVIPGSHGELASAPAGHGLGIARVYVSTRPGAYDDVEPVAVSLTLV